MDHFVEPDLIAEVTNVVHCVKVQREPDSLDCSHFMSVVKKVQNLTGTSEMRAVEIVRYVMRELEQAS